jgi:uncharacterized membrane protein
LIRSEGTVRFEPGPNDCTRLDIHLAYSPPAGVIGHGLAKLFGGDPKSALDDDLGRLKSLLEVGKTRVHDRRVSRSEAF